MASAQHGFRLERRTPNLSTQPEAVWRREEERREALARMAGGVARHLANLLSAIQRSARHALEEAAEPRVREDLLEILDTCARGSRLSSRLLAISGRHWAQPEVADLRKIVLAVDLGPLLSDDVALCMDLPSAPCFTFADPAQLHQVIAALLLNAREAVGERGVVGLSLEEVSLGRGTLRGRWVRLQVSDNGAGMDEATAARALDPFLTTQPDRPGEGLALSFAHGIVKQSGGAMFLDSVPERGTTVTVWLPSAESRKPLPATR